MKPCSPTRTSRFRPAWAFLGVLALGFVMGGSLLAAEQQVPETHETIQSAIDAAGEGDIISIAPGRYFESIDLKGKSIVLKGRGPEPTILDGTGIQGSLIRCVSSEGPFTRIERLVIQNGSGDESVYSSKATVGGGLLLLNASPSLVQCRFEQNQVAYNGGAIYARNSKSTFQSCDFVRNAAEKGGSVYATSCQLDFQTCTFEGNTAAFGGGAIFSSDRTITMVDGCRFIENRASFNGGGIYDYDSATTVKNSVFLNNIGAYKGGAAYHGWRSLGRIGEGNEFRTPNDDVAGSGRMVNEANPVGACLIGGGCILAPESACLEGGGTWAGEDTRCDEALPTAVAKKTPGGDLNRDGRVDVRDMAILLGSWGERNR